MPNFDALLRTGYRDVDGLVLDCSEADVTPSLWLNRAPQHPGLPRFGDPFQDVEAEQPTIVQGIFTKAADFERAAKQHYKVPLAQSFGPDSQRWTFAFQGVPDPGVLANPQGIFGISTPDFNILRRGPGGFEGYLHNGNLVTGAAADWSGGVDVFQTLGGGLIDWWTGGLGVGLRVNNGAFSDIGFPVAPDSAFIGREDAVDSHYDGTLQSMRIWSRRLSVLETDFAFGTIGVDGAGATVDPRATVENAEWNDATGSGARRSNRLRPSVDGGAQRFWLARGPAGARIQIAASVGGVTLPDADLGGDLFTFSTIEAPVEPPMVAEAGWSSVVDVRLANTGHYAFLAKRANGGGVVLHVDFVEEA